MRRKKGGAGIFSTLRRYIDPGGREDEGGRGRQRAERRGRASDKGGVEGRVCSSYTVTLTTCADTPLDTCMLYLLHWFLVTLLYHLNSYPSLLNLLNGI